MKALVTGAAGFLGRHVVQQLLARGDQVRALVRGPGPELDAPGVEIVRADLRDRPAVLAACHGIDAVFHAAALASLWGPWKAFHQANTLATQHVLEGCQVHGVRRLVFTSSASVTFDGKDQEGVGQAAPYSARWLAHYPRSKALAEQQVLAANGVAGLATCALRPYLIWGPRDRHLVPRLLARARAGRLFRVGDGGNRIDIVYVEDAAAAHLQAADALQPGSRLGGRAYFINQGEPVNCWRWIDQILALAGLPPVEKAMSLRAAWRMGAVYETVYAALRLRSEPLMTRFLAAQLATSHWFDLAPARRDFGYAPKISTEEGIRRLAADLKG